MADSIFSELIAKLKKAAEEGKLKDDSEEEEGELNDDDT